MLVSLTEIATGKPLLDRQILLQEVDGLSHVYNYAARFGWVPKTVVRQFTKTVKGHEKAFVEVTIELPQQNIKAAATSKRFELSQSAAAFYFKQQAEAYYAGNGLMKSGVDGVPSLSTDNAKELFKFLDFYRPGTTFTLDMKEIPVPTAGVRRENPYFQAAVLADGEAIVDPVSCQTKTRARSLAFLTAGLTLLENDPGLKARFFKSLRAGHGKVLAPVNPRTTAVAEDCLLAMQDTLRDMRESGLPDDSEQHQPNIEPLEERRLRTRRYELMGKSAVRRSKDLRSMLRQFKHDPRHKDLRSKLQDLPMSQYRTQVLDIVQNNIYSVIVGATGSGKTTQVPQILLDHAIEAEDGAYCNIICTQPRRIAAASVARRVAQERGQQLRDSIGYHVRFDPQLPILGGSITYCTTGILLIQLQLAPDEIFDSISHLIIDEIHERDVDVDFLLILLKNTVKRRRQEGKSVPKIVLMSATIDADLFADYFENESSDGSLTRCPTLKVPGRIFPVKEWYLEDLIQQFSASYGPEELEPFLKEKNTTAYLDMVEEKYPTQSENVESTGGSGDRTEESSIDWQTMRATPPSPQDSTRAQNEDPLVPLGLACATVAHIARTSEAGAVLVFLPGLNEINNLEKMLMEESPLGIDFSNTDKYRIFKLHSLIPANQADVFESFPPGRRKIILSTNIAETSVTIPDVQYIVDLGKSREKIYNQARRISKLACCWISKSNAKQRAGRAGRVQNGNYYALYTREKFNSLRAVGVPEILRIDLQEVCLSVKSQSFETPVREFLSQALEPPPPTQVDASVINLQALEALDQNEEITALGRLLAQLPVHPSLGKMIVLGIIFRCLDPMLIMGAAGGERSLWHLTPHDQRSAAAKIRHGYVGQSNSEHIGILNAVKNARQVLHEAGHKAAYQYCDSNFINFVAFRDILRGARQIREILEEAQLIPGGGPTGSELGGRDLNVNSTCVPLIKALLTSGMFPNVAVSTVRRKAWRTENETAARIHSHSVVKTSSIQGEQPNPNLGKLLIFSSLQKASLGNQLFLREPGEITPLAAMLFGGRLTGKGDVVTMDSWLPFLISPLEGSDDIAYKPAKMIIEFRKALDRVSTNHRSNSELYTVLQANSLFMIQVLTISFRDLSKFNDPRNQRNLQDQRRASPRSGYLADDPVRAMFAERFVEVLLLDNPPKQ